MIIKTVPTKNLGSFSTCIFTDTKLRVRLNKHAHMYSFIHLHDTNVKKYMTQYVSA